MTRGEHNAYNLGTENEPSDQKQQEQHEIDCTGDSYGGRKTRKANVSTCILKMNPPH